MNTLKVVAQNKKVILLLILLLLALAGNKVGKAEPVVKEGAPEGSKLITTLVASLETNKLLGVKTWKINDEKGRRVARGLDEKGTVLYEIANIPSRHNRLIFQTLDSSQKVILNTDGSVLESDSDKLAKAVQALFSDAKKPYSIGSPAATEGIDYDTGWQNCGTSSCTVRTTVDYSGGVGVKAETTIKSPYVFSGCWEETQITLWYDDGSNATLAYKAMACAVWDSSCTSERTVRSQVNVERNVSQVEVFHYPGPTGQCTVRF